MMKQNDLISVIVPVYKVEKYLHRCVDSILNQTYRNLEIILVDDGSPDSCPKICDEYAKRDNRIKVIHKNNAGVSAARNTGLEFSQGEFIAFVDSDDCIETNMYELLHKSIVKNRCDIAMSGYNLLYKNDIKKMMDESILHVNDEKLKSIPDVMFVDNSFGNIWRLLYRRSFIGGHRFSQDFFSGEDLLFNLNLIKKNTKISVVKECLYNYFQRNDSVVHSYSLAKVEQRIKMAKEALELIKPLVGDDYYKDYSFRLYEMCVLDCIFAPNKSELLKYVKTSEFLKTLKIKNNYKIRLKHTKGKIKRLSIKLIYHNCFSLLKILYKLKRAYDTNSKY